jgi:hypothetical protein
MNDRTPTDADYHAWFVKRLADAEGRIAVPYGPMLVGQGLGDDHRPAPSEALLSRIAELEIVNARLREEVEALWRDAAGVLLV